jgi:hypothetical protein
VSAFESEKTEESERAPGETVEERGVSGADWDWEGGLAGDESVLSEALLTVAEEAASGSRWVPASDSVRGEGRKPVGTDPVSEPESAKDEMVD